jgi:(S)-citramalyl-CoA lyase
MTAVVQVAQMDAVPHQREGARRCLLFVPGNRPERFAKALASGADMVCIDLEDATPPAEKARARAAAIAFVHAQQATQSCELVIRINSLRCAEGLADLLALREQCAPCLVMLPKVESVAELEIAAQVLNAPISEAGSAATNVTSGTRQIMLIALIESALGIERAFEIARAPGLAALMFGGADYCAQLGGKMTAAALNYPRARLSAAAASGGIFAIDVPCLAINDELALRSETRAVAELGFTCKSAIHPNQVGPIQAELSPSGEEIAHARALLAAFEASPNAAIAFAGTLIDRPIVLAAQRTLARAG